VFGTLLESARKIAERLDATLVNMRFVKPLDENAGDRLAERHRAFVTIEENAVMGGAGSAVGEVLAAAGVLLPLLQIGIPDKFIEHGSRDTCLAAPASILPACPPASMPGGRRSWRVACAPRKAHDRVQVGVSAHIN
jgi:1-deoxy-D-xylulose-5-phosphate synthase